MSRLSVTMAAREVVAARTPFVQRRGDFSDPGVALDEILSLRAAQEPLVLRVDAVGGTREEREAVGGDHSDWLCDSDGSEPRRIPMPRWDFESGVPGSRPGLNWSKHAEWIDAWETCDRAEWLLNGASHGAMAGPIDYRRSVVLGACACADLLLPELPEDYYLRSPLVACLAEAKRWCGGRPARRPVLHTGWDVTLRVGMLAAGGDRRVTLTTEDAAWAAYYALAAAVNAEAFGDDTYSAAVGACGRHADWAQVAEAADAVRAAVPTIVVLRQAADSLAAADHVHRV